MVRFINKNCYQSDKVVVFERGNLLFIFNFHPTNSYSDYRVGTDWAGEYKILLSSDDQEFGGHNRIDKSVNHFTTPMEWNGRKNWLQVSSLLCLLLTITKESIERYIVQHELYKFSHIEESVIKREKLKFGGLYR